MQMLKGFGAAVKRGKHQALQRVGVYEETKDSEYDESRDKVRHCKATFKELEKQVKTLETNVRALNGTFTGIVGAFGDFGRMLDPEGDVQEFSEVMDTAVRNMSQQMQAFVETVTNNSLEIVRTAQRHLDQSEESHSEIRESQVDMDALKHDVRTLRDSLNDTKLTSAKAEKAKSQLLTLQANLDTHISHHESMSRTAKKKMAVATSDASTSLWSIYSILFNQTQQHFKDLGSDMALLATALTSVKNSGIQKIKEQRSPLILKKGSSEAVLAAPADPASFSTAASNNDVFQSPPHSTVIGDTSRAELCITAANQSLSPAGRAGSKDSLSENREASRSGLAPPGTSSPLFKETPIGEMFLDGGEGSGWQPSFEEHVTDNDEKWADF